MKHRRKQRIPFLRIFIILMIVFSLGFLIVREIAEYRHRASVEEDIELLPGHGYDLNKLQRQENYMSYEDAHYSSSFGIDISEHNGTIDFDKVKKAGVDFVIIRAGWRGASEGVLHVDKCVEEYYRGAKNAGLEVGFYFFSQAVNEQEAVEEADYFVSIIKGKSFDLPLAYDYEDFPDGRISDLTGEERTVNAKAFLERIRMHNYNAILYANMAWLQDYYLIDEIRDYDLWFAQYYDLPEYTYPFSIWQYSETGSIDGIEGNVDLNIRFDKK